MPGLGIQFLTRRNIVIPHSLPGTMQRGLPVKGIGRAYLRCGLNKKTNRAAKFARQGDNPHFNLRKSDMGPHTVCWSIVNWGTVQVVRQRGRNRAGKQALKRQAGQCGDTLVQKIGHRLIDLQDQ